MDEILNIGDFLLLYFLGTKWIM